MKPLCEIVDRCLRLMKPYQIFSWEDWWEKVIQDGEVPTCKTAKHYKWIEKRLRAKNSINKELERRNRPERIIPVGYGQGVYLIDEKEVAPHTVDRRVRRIVGCVETGQKEMRGLEACPELPDKDKAMVKNVNGVLALWQNTILGTLAKLDLQEDTKKRLMKHLGLPAAKEKKSKKPTKKKRRIPKWTADAKKEYTKTADSFPASQIIKTQKKAAKYAGVSGRTIRRWVSECGMPVTTDGCYIKAALDKTNELNEEQPKKRQCA